MSKIFEYKFVNANWDKKPFTLVETQKLVDCGIDGWECFHMERDWKFAYTIFALKREK
jgi:hypothetical protein